MIRQAGCVPLGSRQHCPLERHVPEQEGGDGDGVPGRDDGDGEPDQEDDGEPYQGEDDDDDVDTV